MGDIIAIEVPDMNDSMVRIVIDSVPYQLRFTYNDTGGYWMFGIYNMHTEPIVQGLKVVPRFVLNLYCTTLDIPYGVFGVQTKLDKIGRNDFKNGKATFLFAPAELDELEL